MTNFLRGIPKKHLYILLGAMFVAHLSVVLFLYFSQVPALGGGADFDGYHQNAVEIASRFSRGDFSLEGLFTVHYFPVLIALLYMLITPHILVGQLFAVFLACLSAILLYGLAKEVGASEKVSFWVSLALVFYPSYLYFGSLLLKDIVIMPLALGALWLSVLMLKSFSPLRFIWFFILLSLLIHFRFYIGFAVIFAFLTSWPLVALQYEIKKRLMLWAVLAVLVGFSPMVVGYGYYGTAPLAKFLNKDVITTYREVVYAPPESQPATSECEKCKNPSGPPILKPANVEEDPCVACKVGQSGSGSSFSVKVNFNNPVAFAINYVISFISSIFGPFPWQLRYARHAMFLAETMPFYLIWILSAYGLISAGRAFGYRQFFRNHRYVLPLAIFVVFSFGALSLYINNFGIITRIRLPMYAVMLCIAAVFISVNVPSFIKRLPWKNI